MTHKEKKRPTMSIAGRKTSTADLREAVNQASTAWLQGQREPKAKATKREHRRLTAEQREAKAKATAQAERQRKEEREAREHERLMGRIAYLSRRSEREAEAMLRVRVGWKSSSEPKVTSICPHSLYSRLRPDISDRLGKVSKRSRIAADGFKNIVLRRTSRGYGRKKQGTRQYRSGEAADLARYILREDGIEQNISACLTNILVTAGDNALYKTDTFSADDRRCAQIVGFWNALEAFEAEADPGGNVFSHLILAMPHELSPAGRAQALEDLCLRLNRLHLPFVAALHRPDADGDNRNFHAHIMMASRPFSIEGPFTWEFEAGKATEFNLPAGIAWLREQAAEAYNHSLAKEGKAVRYSGVSQAKRGVPASGDTHDGPVITARKRKEQADKLERNRLTRGLAAHVVRVAERQAELGRNIEQAARQSEMASSSPATAASPGPSALEALRAKFPNPLHLKGLSFLDFMDFTPAEKQADNWYIPSFNLLVELQRIPNDLIRDRDGQPEFIKENMDSTYSALVNAPELPDIVQEVLLQAHRRIVANAEWEKRVAREKEQIRQQRLTALQKKPILLFDERLNVLPQYREFFPPEVIALEGVRAAMLKCHRDALRAMHQLAVNEAKPDPTRIVSPQAATDSPIEQTPKPPEAEDDGWDLILGAAHAGRKGGKGK